MSSYQHLSASAKAVARLEEPEQQQVLREDTRTIRHQAELTRMEKMRANRS